MRKLSTLFMAMLLAVPGLLAADFPTELYLMTSAMFTQAPAPKATDQMLPQASEGVYKGNLEVNSGNPFGFYAGTPGNATTCYVHGANAQVAMSNTDYWPDPEDPETEAEATVKTATAPAMLQNWYFSSLPQGAKTATLGFTVNLNTMKISIGPAFEEVAVEGLRVAYGSLTNNVAPADGDPVLALQSDGKYVGSFAVEYTGAHKNYQFYSVDDADAITWYGFQTPVGDNIYPANQYVDFSKNDTQNFTGLLSGDEQKKLGIFSSTAFPAGFSNGTVTATVDLTAGTVTLVYAEPATGKEYYFMGSTNGGSTLNVRLPMTRSEADPNVYEITYVVPEVFEVDDPEDGHQTFDENQGFPFYVSLGSSSTGKGYLPEEGANIIEFDDQISTYEEQWSYASLADNPFAIDMSPGRTVFRFNSKTEKMAIEYTPDRFDESKKLYIATYEGNNAAYRDEIAAPTDDQYILFNLTTGRYEGEVELRTPWLFYPEEGDAQAVNEWFKLYADSKFYGPMFSSTIPAGAQVNFNDGDFTGEFASNASSTAVGAWRVTDFVGDNTVSGVVRLSVDLTAGTLEAVQISAKEQGENRTLFFLWGTNGPSATWKARVPLEPMEDAPSVYTYTMNVPECEYDLDDPEYPPLEDEDGTGMAFMYSSDYSVGKTSIVYAGIENQRVIEPTDDKTNVTELKVELSGVPFIDRVPGVTTFVLDTEAMTLTVTKSGNSIVFDVAPVEAPAVYYDLQGRRVANPERGIFIRVEGAKATKVVK